MTTPATLESLAIFNSEFGQREGYEHEKILYYYPDTLDEGRQVRNIGLAQALVSFTRTFSPEKLCEAVHTTMRKQAFFEAEPNFWLILTVLNPSYKKKSNGRMVTRYKEDELSDELLQYALRGAHALFKLFHGGLGTIIAQHGVDELRRQLTNFYEKYLRTINFDQMNVIDSFEGINFLPVDKNVYLRVVCFSNLICNRIKDIKEVVVLYRDHLVWSGLEQDDIRVLYRYLIDKIGIDGENPSPDIIIPIHRNSPSGFLTGPLNLEDNLPFTLPVVYLGPENERVYLVLYRRKEMTCVFFFETLPTNLQVFHELQEIAVHQIDRLCPVISDYYNTRKQGNADDTYKYLYFNNMNLAMKTSLKKGATLSKDILKCLTQMHLDFNSKGGVHEQIINLGNNKWVGGIRSENREIYVIFEDKKTILNDVSEDLRKLCASFFSNIFIDC